jgi:hypothetical protein
MGLASWMKNSSFINEWAGIQKYLKKTVVRKSWCWKTNKAELSKFYSWQGKRN